MPHRHIETLAREIVRQLQIESARHLHIDWWWVSIDRVATLPEHVDALQMAVDHDWIQLSPGFHSVALRDKGRRLETEPPRRRGKRVRPSTSELEIVL
jgi:hypothetical protein